MQMTREKAASVLTMVQSGLACRKDNIGNSLTLAQAICVGLEMPLSERPEGVAYGLSVFANNLADAAWSSDAARAEGMKRLALAILGSAGKVNEQAFFENLISWQTVAGYPFLLNLAGKAAETPWQQELEAAATNCTTMDNEASVSAALAICNRALEAADDARPLILAAVYCGDLIRSAYKSMRVNHRLDVEPVIRGIAENVADAFVKPSRYIALLSSSEAGTGVDSSVDSFLRLISEAAVEKLTAQSAPGIEYLDLCPA